MPNPGKDANLERPRSVPAGRTIHPLAIPVLHLLSLGIYVLVWLYRRYAEIRRAHPEATNISPGQAVGFQFIPVFNIFWVFYVWYDLARALSRLQIARVGRSLVWPHFVPILLWGAAPTGIIMGLLVGVVVELTGVGNAAKWAVGASLVSVPLFWWAMIIAQVSLNYVWSHVATPARVEAVPPVDPARHFYRRQLWRATACLVPIFFGFLLLLDEGVRIKDFTSRQGSRLGLGFVSEPTVPVPEQDIERTIELIRSRAEAFGVPAPVVQRSKAAGEAVEVMLPVTPNFNRERISGLLLMSSVLDLKGVVAGPFASESEAQAAQGNVIPEDEEILRDSGQPAQYFVCKKQGVLGPDDVRRAQATTGVDGRPAVSVVLSEPGGERMRRYSRAHIGQQLAIVLDGKVVSAPTIQGEIGADIQITGQFTTMQAQDLALILRAMSLPHPLRVVSQDEFSSTRWLLRQAGRTGIVALVFAVMIAILFRLVPRCYGPIQR